MALTKGLVLILLAGVSSNALPNPYGIAARHNSPNCICLEGNQQVKNAQGQVVSGRYSYVDPLGVEISVSYKSNGRGGFTEERTTTKDHKVSEAQVVKDVLQGLQREVLRTIETTLRGASPTLNGKALAEKVLSNLRPIVSKAIRTALEKRGSSTSNGNSLTSRVLIAVRPFVADRIRQHKRQQQHHATSVTTIANTAPVATHVTTVVEETATNSNNNNNNDLVARIVAQLKPLIAKTVSESHNSNHKNVDQTVTTTTTGHGISSHGIGSSGIVSEFSTDLITDLVTSLRDAISDSVSTTVSASSTHATNDAIVSQIVRKLQPRVHSVVTETVRQRGLYYTPAQISRLESRITSALRPVIRSSVAEYRRTHTSTLTSTTNGVDHSVLLQPAFVGAVSNEIKTSVGSITEDVVSSISNDSVNDETVIQDVISRLRLLVTGVVELEILERGLDIDEYAFFSSDSFSQLISKVMSAVTSDVRREVREHRQQKNSAILLQPAFVNGVANEIRTTSVASITEEIITGLPTDPIDNETVVQDVIARLRLLVKGVVEMQILERGLNVDEYAFYSSDSFSQLISKVMSAVTSDVRREVRERLVIVRQQMSLDYVSSQLFIDEVASLTRHTAHERVSEMSETFDESTSVGSVVARISVELEPIVIKNVRSLIQERGLVVSADFYTTDAFYNCVDLIAADLRAIIEQDVILFRRVVATVTSEVTYEARQQAQTLTEAEPGRREAEILDEVNQILSVSIRDQLAAETKYEIFGNTILERLYQQVINSLRTIILDNIRLVKGQQQQQQHQQHQTLTQTVTSTTEEKKQKIGNIFGFGGPNSVRVNTPQYQYSYTHE